MNNIIALTDSYKFSHFNQLPPGAEQVYSYMESRGGEYEDIIFFGLQYFLEKYLTDPIHLLNYRDIAQTNIQDAEQQALRHGVPYNYKGWGELLEDKYERNKQGLPIEIKAVPEGSINKPGDVLMTITNTDDRYPWLVGWLETLLMKVWYPTTIASKSFAVKQMLKAQCDATSDNAGWVDFAYHNFGDRGSSSVESAAIGGVAHLTQFKGTDNFNSLLLAHRYYDEPTAGFSIPATEHSTVTSWGRENEFRFYENYLETYKNSVMIACVLDSYDIFKAVDFVTSGAMKDKIESEEYPIFVIRPDSGHPLQVIHDILAIMDKNEVSYTVNSKGFKVFNKYRIIWGDGITSHTIENILSAFRSKGYAADNFAFGSGGDLMQNVNRDTCKFAIKCSAIKVDGEWRDVYKEPITDPEKKSKRGLVTNPNLRTVYKDGKVLVNDSLSIIRERSNG